MMNRLENAARQALEVLEYVLKPTADFDEAVCQKLHDTAIAALREALAEQAAEQRSQNCGTGFCSCIECPYEQPATKQAAEPVTLETVYETIIKWDEGGGKRSRRELARRIVALYAAPTQQPLTEEQKAVLRECRNQAMKWTAQAGIPECAAFGGIAQDLDWLCGQLGITGSTAPTRQPLTEEQIGEIGRNHEKFDKAGNEWFDRWAFARAIEAAHGITSKKGGAA